MNGPVQPDASGLDFDMDWPSQTFRCRQCDYVCSFFTTDLAAALAVLTSHQTDQHTIEPEWQSCQVIGWREQAEATQDRLEVALSILADMADDNPCAHDHHGYCQAHDWLQNEPTCPQRRLRDFAAFHQTNKAGS